MFCWVSFFYVPFIWKPKFPKPNMKLQCLSYVSSRYSVNTHQLISVDESWYWFKHLLKPEPVCLRITPSIFTCDTCIYLICKVNKYQNNSVKLLQLSHSCKWCLSYCSDVWVLQHFKNTVSVCNSSRTPKILGQVFWCFSVKTGILPSSLAFMWLAVAIWWSRKHTSSSKLSDVMSQQLL